jgi:hypothetical protein
VLLGDQDIAQHGARDLAPAGALGGESELAIREPEFPIESRELASQVGVVSSLRTTPAGFNFGLEGLSQLPQRGQVVRAQSRPGGPVECT